MSIKRVCGCPRAGSCTLAKPSTYRTRTHRTLNTAFRAAGSRRPAKNLDEKSMLRSPSRGKRSMLQSPSSGKRSMLRSPKRKLRETVHASKPELRETVPASKPEARAEGNGVSISENALPRIEARAVRIFISLRGSAHAADRGHATRSRGVRPGLPRFSSTSKLARNRCRRALPGLAFSTDS